VAEKIHVNQRGTTAEPATSDSELLRTLRSHRHLHRGSPQPLPILTTGQRIADGVAAIMGSWPFIVIQSIILVAWVTLNLVAYAKHWDPYPFILLNLALSFQAAYAAPIIMMSQNRQQDIDRQAAANDYQINIKAELEIEALHEKLDHLREVEVLELTRTVQQLSALLERAIEDAQRREKALQPPGGGN
jgi:uncharacterized membrane protein